MVYGIPNIKSQTLEAYLFKDNKKALVYISDTPQKGYVKIVTSYKVLEKILKKLLYFRHTIAYWENTPNTCTFSSYWLSHNWRWKIWNKQN